MAVEYNDKVIKMDGIISDNEIAPLREHLHSVAPSEINFDLTDCDDIHTAVLQLINAYSAIYKATFTYSGESAFKKAIDGFVICEN